MDPQLALVILALINTVGSVLITWLRYYYRSRYPNIDGNGGSNGGRPETESLARVHQP